jgi:hypothetical protein
MKYNEIQKEDLIRSSFPCLTMKDLRDFIDKNKDLPDDTKVLTERVEDRYFGPKGIPVLLVKGEHYLAIENRNKEMEEEIARRERGEESEYKLIDNPEEYITRDFESVKEQFFHSWCITKDESFIYIYNHY